MADNGMLPRSTKIYDPVFIEQLDSRNLDEIRKAGYIISEIQNDEYWAKIKDIRGQTVIVCFEVGDIEHSDVRFHAYGTLDVTKDGWRYFMDADFEAPPHQDIEITEVETNSIDAEYIDKKDSTPLNIDLSDRTKIQKYHMNEPMPIDKTERVIESFEQFSQPKVNEEDMIVDPNETSNEPCEDCDHADTLSENAKSAIKRMVDEVLMNEAHLTESSDDPNQTYETFLREATHYMAECMIRSAQNLKM